MAMEPVSRDIGQVHFGIVKITRRQNVKKPSTSKKATGMEGRSLKKRPPLVRD